MEILKNQTLYKCSFCGQRKLTKKGCLLHEESYCQNDESPNKKRQKEKQLRCQHHNVETQYSYIPGEAVEEPAYDLCIDCGAKL